MREEDRIIATWLGWTCEEGLTTGFVQKYRHWFDAKGIKQEQLAFFSTSDADAITLLSALESRLWDWNLHSYKEHNGISRRIYFTIAPSVDHPKIGQEEFVSIQSSICKAITSAILSLIDKEVS